MDDENELPQQQQLSDFAEPEEDLTEEEAFRRRINQKRSEFCGRHPQASILMRPIGMSIAKAPPKPDELKPYRINLGTEEQWNFDEFLNQPGYLDTYTEFQRIYRMDRPFNFQFSATRDANNILQSEHCFLSGSTGQGKTNLASLITLGFPKRPNPTSTLWISQKSSTASIDIPKLMNILEDAGKKSVKITLGEECEEGKLPLSILQPDDVQKWFGMSKPEYQVFQGILYGFRKQGGGIQQALGEFIGHSKGARFASMYDGLIYGNIFTIKRKEYLDFKPHWTYFLDASELLSRESHTVADIILNGWLNHLYTWILQKRRDAAREYADDPEYYKKQWQGMVVFDEFYDLSKNFLLPRLMKNVSRVATQGRQDGVSLTIATQTVFGTHGENKVPISQASHIFQFKPSSNADQHFVMRTMGWEGSQYENQLTEIFSKVFPVSKDKFSHKGRIILFSKDSNTVGSAKLKLLE